MTLFKKYILFSLKVGAKITYMLSGIQFKNFNYFLKLVEMQFQFKETYYKRLYWYIGFQVMNNFYE